MDVEKQQRLLDEIERRLMLCEEAIGMDPARQKGARGSPVLISRLPRR